MTLTVRNDTKHPEGGHAILEGPGLDGVDALSVENGYAPGQYLGGDGRWSKQPHVFPVKHTGQGLLLGPEIVDHIVAELQVGFRTAAGADIGKVFWVDIVPRRSTRGGIGAITGGKQGHSGPGIIKGGGTTGTGGGGSGGQTGTGTDPGGDATGATGGGTGVVDLERPDPKKAFPWRRAAILAGLLLVLAGSLAGVKVLADRQPVEPHHETAAPINCEATFKDRLEWNALRSMADVDRVKLAEQALTAGCGAEAFHALDQESDWQTNEAAAWYTARFWDPNETEPVYRHISRANARNAAVVYLKWRATSPRQASALAKLCQSDRQLLDSDSDTRGACAR